MPLRVVGTLISWGVDETAEAFVVSPDRLQQSACAGAALEECNLVVVLFADPQGTAAQEALSAGGYTETFPPSSVERMQQVGRIPWYLASFLALLALVATFNLLVTTLRRRRRDLAVARVFGMTARGSGAPLSLQAVFLATAGAALGLLLGIVGGRGPRALSWPTISWSCIAPSSTSGSPSRAGGRGGSRPGGIGRAGHPGRPPTSGRRATGRVNFDVPSAAARRQHLR